MAIAKRRKKFFEIEIPIINKEVPLQAYELSDLEGRQIKYDLTRLLRGKGSVLTLNVSIEENKAIATPTKFTLLPYYIKRMLRTGTNYVEDSFKTDCLDANIKIKPFLITRKKVSRAVRKALRNECKKELIEKVKEKSVEEILSETFRGTLQKTLSLSLKKIYPLALFEIRVLEIEKKLEAEPNEKVEVTKEIKDKKEESEKNTKKEKTEEKKKSDKKTKETKDI